MNGGPHPIGAPVDRPRRTEFDRYIDGTVSFVVGLRPPDALAMSWLETLDVLRQRFGDAVDVALSDPATDLTRSSAELPEVVRSPRAGDADSTWVKRTNMVGINVRTVGDFAGVVKYALTLPGSVDSIHLLPIWEPGAVGSLYGIASWNLNAEFVSAEMLEVTPALDSAALQLRAMSNLLHVMGKTVGMDVIPHTDRFSEPALANPNLFEWMHIEQQEIIAVGDSVADAVIDATRRWFDAAGPATSETSSCTPAGLFSVDEATRLLALFGHPDDLSGRTARRVDLLRHLKRAGLEPVPATMGVPFRGIEIDTDAAHVVVDDSGLEWPDFVISEPQLMSRVFSPLTRFHLYESSGDGLWGLDFQRPRRHVWSYVCERYAEVQRVGAFDFMRGDMAHVQMRPDGVPESVDAEYDILGAVKHHIASESAVPWFGYFAESFLPARDVFQYGEELDHLEASLADATLGDLQSTPVGSVEHLSVLRRYLDDLATRRTAPAYTVMTADKDDPRFDEFYRDGNEARMFTALFLPDMPSYTGLGFELRDRRTEPVENERYTKLFVFHESGESNVYPSKARFGTTYVWGSNDELFDRLTQLRSVAEQLLPIVGGCSARWLIAPDATGLRGTAAWTLEPTPRPDGLSGYVFVVNYDVDAASGFFGIPAIDAQLHLVPVFSTTGTLDGGADAVLRSNGHFHRLEDLAPGEGRIYRMESASL